MITGTADRIIPPQNSQYLAKNIPNSKLELIPEAGHALCFSHSDQATAIMTSLLAAKG